MHTLPVSGPLVATREMAMFARATVAIVLRLDAVGMDASHGHMVM